MTVTIDEKCGFADGMDLEGPTDGQLPTLPDRTSVVWGQFDAAWYLEAYPSARRELREDDPASALRFYQAYGRLIGHGPNIFFDESWYSKQCPDIPGELRPSGFDHYCRVGFHNRSPHWLFDEVWYRRRYPSLTNEALADAGFVNGYDHYLKHGALEGRVAHVFFDPAIYQANLDPAEARVAEAMGPFGHYLHRIASGAPEVRTSAYFDPEWYLERYKAVREAIGRGAWLCALHHYLTNDTPTAFDPLPEFSEAHYLRRHPDINTAVRERQHRNGYEHFLGHGALELRSPSTIIDLHYYASHEQVRDDLLHERVTDAFTHYLIVGRNHGLAPVPLPAAPVNETVTKGLFRSKASSLLPLVGRTRLDFSYAYEPTITVIVVVHNQFEMTLLSLGSLRVNFPGDLRLIIVDSGSTDETRFIANYVRGATVIVCKSNIGFVRACNAALEAVSSKAVLLLNNDVELAPGAIAAALRRLLSVPSIGAVGGKVIRTHGLLQEAGNIIWADGTTEGYLRDASPLVPEANFVRDVDFCSGVFLMVRTSVFRLLGGFDEAFAPAYYEETDLCVRMAAAGFRTVYDPSVVIYHYEYGSSSDPETVGEAVVRNRDIFVRRHGTFLQSRVQPDPQSHTLVRSPVSGTKRILFIEDTVPLRRIGSGFVRSNDLLRVMASLGYQVTLFPLNGCEFNLAAVYADMPDTVEVIHDKTIDALEPFLWSRKDYYDTLWIGRTHNLTRCSEIIEGIAAREHSRPKLVLDTEAVASRREHERANVLGQSAAFDFDAAIHEEFAAASLCDVLVAVSQSEAQLLRELGHPKVAIIGHARTVDATPNRFDQRLGILFVAAIHEMDSPNYDSLCWLIEDVMPLVGQILKEEARLTVVGYTSGRVSLDRFRHRPQVELLGTVSDIRPLYDSHRLFVAPTRYAAGIPYKVYEAASFGLPVVATELLRQQMAWENGCELLSADATDPRQFAAEICRLHRDEALWQEVRSNALRRIAIESNWERYTALVRSVIEGQDVDINETT